MIKTFYSEVSNGIMSSKKDFYPNMSKEEIIKELKKRRIELGKLKGFSGKKMIVPSQDIELKKHNNGQYEDVTERVMDILSDNPYYDLWNLDIPCDIMLIRSNLKGVVLTYPSADCPVVIASSNDTIALAHTSAVHIDRNLPNLLIDSLRKVSNCKDDEIKAYVGPCAGESYIYETYPSWAKNDDWKYFITETTEGYKIDLKKAVYKELKDSGVKDITISSVDTIIDSRFYSNYAYKHGFEEKNGRFLTGAYFTGKTKLLKK